VDILGGGDIGRDHSHGKPGQRQQEFILFDIELPSCVKPRRNKRPGNSSRLT
jgi:hypothetical protein